MDYAETAVKTVRRRRRPSDRVLFWTQPRPDVVSTTFPPEREASKLELLIVIVVILLLLGSFGPRAGWYGTTGMLWDVVSLILFVVLIVVVLQLLGVAFS